MGGRRSRPIYEIIQRTPETKEAISSLSDSIEKLDMNGIANKSGKLFSNIIGFAESFIHTQSFLEEIKKDYKRKVDIPIKEFEKVIRRRWALYKKQKKILKLSTTAEYNIIHAVSRALKEGQKE